MDRYLAITAIILLGAFGFPVPVPLAGLLATAGVFAAQGALCVALLIALAAGGAIIGDTLGYASGRFGLRLYLRRGIVMEGHASHSVHRLRRLLGKVVASRTVKRAVGWSNARLSRGGSMAVLILLSRTVLGTFGPVINILSGARRYPIGRFLLYDAVGETLWVGAYVGIGFVAGRRGGDANALLRNPLAIAVAIALMIAPIAITARIKPSPRALSPS
ncbi:MAG: DedA family protein [Thermomicrobiales bacterium]